MNKLARVRALLIDIDDTITHLRVDRPELKLKRNGNWSDSLFDVLQSAGVALGGLTPDETARRIARVKAQVSWWHWSDFIAELGLDAKRFWEYAYDTELEYLEATGPEIRPALTRLRDNGMLLYISSNNPNDGILHKLRLAGLANGQGAPLFKELLGVAGLQAMKWEPVYWQKALAQVALAPEEVAVVGDGLRDDYEVPHAAGLACTFLLNLHDNLSALDTASLIHVQNFNQIADRLLAGRKQLSSLPTLMINNEADRARR
jgi:FMN phosphatase YigB (HAD superfamily)